MEAEWRTANYRHSEVRRGDSAARRGALRIAREAAGRMLMGLGQRVLPAGVEPCA